MRSKNHPKIVQIILCIKNTNKCIYFVRQVSVDIFGVKNIGDFFVLSGIIIIPEKLFLCITYIQGHNSM